MYLPQMFHAENPMHLMQQLLPSPDRADRDFDSPSLGLLPPPGVQHFPVELTVTTWSRDSHELFDYESRNISEQRFVMHEFLRRFYRKDGEVIPCSDDPDAILRSTGGGLPEHPLEYLLRTYCMSDGRLIVSPVERERTQLPPWFYQQLGVCHSKKLWLVVKEVGQYALAEGDVLKLGRFKLRVRQLKAGPIDEDIQPDIAEAYPGGVADVCPKDADNAVCRICLLEGAGTDEDPLVEACHCKGSIQYVHLQCLRYWINGRLSSSTPCKDVFEFKKLPCELCKHPYPMQVRLHTGQVADLIPLPKTKAPYIVLENMMKTDPGDGSGAQSRGYYIISLSGKKMLKLGRGHESDLRIADVSISRWHATVSFTEDHRFVIEDHNSKFGTLIALRRSRVMDVETTPEGLQQKLVVQVGRSVFYFRGMSPEKLKQVEERREQEEGLLGFEAGERPTIPGPPSLLPQHAHSNVSDDPNVLAARFEQNMQ